MLCRQFYRQLCGGCFCSCVGSFVRTLLAVLYGCEDSFMGSFAGSFMGSFGCSYVGSS